MTRDFRPYKYVEARNEEAKTWRKIAEAALQRANLCEGAAQEAAHLGKLDPVHFTDSYLLVEMEKIDKRFHQRMQGVADTQPPFVGPLDCEGLTNWLNNHTFNSGPTFEPVEVKLTP